MAIGMGLAIAGGSSLIGAGASLLAGNKQAKAAEKASQVQRDQFNMTNSNLQPWQSGGNMALSQLNHLMGFGSGHMSRPTNGESSWVQDTPNDPNAPLSKPFSLADFQESPAYQFNLQEGQKAIDKASSARGKYYSPATLQDISKYSQGMASNEFQNAFNNYNTNQNNLFSRLQTLSGSGQNAAAQTGAFGANMANQVGGNIIGAGNANAAGLVGASNAISGGVGDYYNYQLMNKLLSQQQPTYGVNAGNGGPVFGGS